MMHAGRAIAVLLLALPVLPLAGCGGLLDSKLAAPQLYVLRLPPQAPVDTSPTLGRLQVQRPEAGPGLYTDRIVLMRSGGRFDVYAAARWAAPAPMLVEDALVQALRGSGSYEAVVDDHSAFPAEYDLRVKLRRFEAEYASDGADPVVHVVMDCTVGHHRSRRMLASFTAAGTVRAEANRLGSVVAAFEQATAGAVGQLLAATHAAIAGDRHAAASEGR